MEERSTLARPYAVAVFELAQQSNELERWGDTLELLSAVATDPVMRGLIVDPRVEHAQLVQIFLDVGGDRLDERARNLVQLLADKRRLELLDELKRLYDEERERAEKRQTVIVRSAFDLDEAFESQVADAMAKRLGTSVDIEARRDESLIGGVVISAGDLVIDASVRGRLEKLALRLG